MAVGPGAVATGLLSVRVTPASLLAWLIGLALIGAGAALTIGFLTPIAGVAVGLIFLGAASGWFSPVAPTLPEIKLTLLAAMIISAALVLIGPGAFSLDSYLFGRREIIIPSSSTSKPL